MKNNISIPSHDSSKVVTFGVGIIIIIFVVFGGWMALAPLAASSVAVGEVSADANKKVVQHLQGGTISKILVREGSIVKKDEVLIKLDILQTKLQLDALKREYMDSKASFSRLIAQRDDKNSINYSSDVTDRNIIQDHENIFFARNKSLKDQEEISQQRITQLENQISGFKSIKKVRKNRIASLTEELKEWKALYALQLVDKIKIRDIEREINNLNGEIENNKSETLKLEEQINEIKTQQLLSKKEYKNEVLDEIVQVKNKISNLESKINSFEDIIAKSDIKAPISGIVVGLKSNTEGSVIKPGDDILQIIPENSDLIVVAKVNIKDIDKVTTGLFADIIFSAFNLKQAHVIQGEVIHLSADRFTDEATDLPYYEAKIKVTNEGKKQLEEYGFKLLPGMPAEVMIKLGTRTPLSYFVKPFTEMLTRGFNEE